MKLVAGADSISLPDAPCAHLVCAGIDDVSILQQAPNIEVLSMSVNKISSLRHFAFCSQLKQLYLRANGVTDLAEVR
jgi:Leucine-rich repeat (LRR) protein